MLLYELAAKLSPHVNRVGSDILNQDLKFLQQAVIHVRQTKPQIKLYRAFKRYRRMIDNFNFFFAYQNLFPVNNHPASLLEKKYDERDRNGNFSDDDDFDVDFVDEATKSSKCKEDIEDPWWHEIRNNTPNFSEIKNGAKVVVLLHILAHCDVIGELSCFVWVNGSTIDYNKTIRRKGSFIFAESADVGLSRKGSSKR